jgi:hypothetical protein
MVVCSHPYVSRLVSDWHNTSVVELIERVILRGLTQLTTATGSRSICHPPHITTTTNPYPPQLPSNVSCPSPADQSAPVMSSLRPPPPAQSSQGQVIQTHIFAPVVTGAPTKKTKFPNTGSWKRSGYTWYFSFSIIQTGYVFPSPKIL